MPPLEYWIAILTLGSLSGILRYIYVASKRLTWVKVISGFILLTASVLIGLTIWWYSWEASLYMLIAFIITGALGARQQEFGLHHPNAVQMRR